MKKMNEVFKILVALAFVLSFASGNSQGAAHFAWLRGELDSGPVEVLITFDVREDKALFAEGIGLLVRGEGLQGGDEVELKWRAFGRREGGLDHLALSGGIKRTWQEWEMHFFDGRELDRRVLRIGNEDGAERRQELEIRVNGELVRDPLGQAHPFHLNLAEAVRSQRADATSKCSHHLRGSAIWTVAPWLL